MAVRRLCLVCLAVPLGVLSSCSPGSGNPPNLVLIVIDTARADRFAACGDDRRVTPVFCEFASNAIRFERAYSTSTWTLPAHASFFTGLLPATHQATQESLHLSDAHETLAELLRQRGYDTAAFSNNPWVSHKTNMLQGFDHAELLWGQRNRTAADGLPHPTNEAISAWLDRRGEGRPLLLFVNYIEPHWPYDAPRLYRERALAALEPPVTAEEAEEAGFSFADWYAGRAKGSERLFEIRGALSDAELAYADAVLGELLQQLNEQRLLDGSLVVITSDHGENLGEHGHQDHAFSLYETTLRVPLAVRPPGYRAVGQLRRDPVQLTDLFVVAAKQAGVELSDERIVGRDLLEETSSDERPILAEYYYPEQALTPFAKQSASMELLAPFLTRLRSIRVGDHKLIWRADGPSELYDLREDPDERIDRIALTPGRADALGRRIEEMLGPLLTDPEPVPEAPLDPEMEEELRALGYVP